MTEPYLILHKVRGNPAFDIATKLECGICRDGYNGATPGDCHECNGEGFWWIIPTSGHRAYPFWHIELSHIDDVTVIEHKVWSDLVFDHAITIPADWPDHYSCNDHPIKHEPKPSLLAQLGLGLKGIVRRI